MLDIILKVLIGIGIPSLIGASIYIGRKLQILDEIEKDIEQDIKPPLKEVERRVAILWAERLFIKKGLNQLGQANSPLVPNEKGWQVLEKSGWNVVYPQLKQKIFAEMDKQPPNNLYDVERAAQKVLMLDLRDIDEIIPLKNYAVNHPDMPLDVVLGVASWIVRDDYAKERNIK